VAALLFAVNPRMVASSSSVQSDGLHLALFLVSVLLGWRALDTKRAAPTVGAGLLCALAYLTRPEGALFAAVFGAWLAVEVVARRTSLFGAAWLGVAFAVPFLMTAAPYLIALSQEAGQVTLTEKKSVVAIAQLGGASALPFGPALREVLVEAVRALNEGYVVLLLLGIRWGRPSRQTLYLLSYVALLAFVLLGLRLEMGYVSRRHWLTGAALLLPFAGRGLADAIQILFGRWVQAPLARRLAWGLVGGVIAGFALDAVMDREDPDKLARKEAALWLRRHATPQVVAAHRSRVAYYAGADLAVPLPATPDPRSFSKELHSSGADFLVAEADRLPSQLREGGAGLRVVHRVPYSGGVVLVVRIGSAPPDVGAGP
jgi:hypothetical protein